VTNRKLNQRRIVSVEGYQRSSDVYSLCRINTASQVSN